MRKRKTVRPGVREISPVSIYSEVYGGKDLRKMCVLSLEWKENEWLMVTEVVMRVWIRLV